MQTKLVISTSGAGRRSVSHRTQTPRNYTQWAFPLTCVMGFGFPPQQGKLLDGTVGCRASSVSSVSISGPAGGLSRTVNPAQPLLEAVWPIQHVEQADACL